MSTRTEHSFYHHAPATDCFTPHQRGLIFGVSTIQWLVVGCVLMTHCGARADVGRIGTGTDGDSLVKAFTSRSQTNVASFFAFGPTFSGGVRVAVGDVNDDGAVDIITGSGAGAAQVKVFSGRDQSELHSFLPYGASFSGGIFVASGDVNGDGFDDVLTGAGAGARPDVKVFDGRTGAELCSFFAYPESFKGGVSVATGDVNGDGRADIITGAGPGGGPHVKVFDGASQAEVRTITAYGDSFLGGVFVGGGDVDGDGFDDIITGAGPGGGPHVKVFDGRTGRELQSFLAYSVSFGGGVRVAAGDLDGDGRAEIVTGPGFGGAPHVRVFDGQSAKETAGFLAYPLNATNGVFISVASAKPPLLEFRRTRWQEEIQLQWPSGCLCDLEANPDPSDPRGWRVVEDKLVEVGNRIGLLLPATQKLQFFRLKCDGEAVR